MGSLPQLARPSFLSVWGYRVGPRREADLGLYLSTWLPVDWVHGCRVQSDCVQNQTGYRSGDVLILAACL